MFNEVDDTLLDKEEYPDGCLELRKASEDNTHLFIYLVVAIINGKDYLIWEGGNRSEAIFVFGSVREMLKGVYANG